MANVTPIHKGGRTSCVKNYRPISLLPCPSKLLERLVFDKLVAFLEKNKVFGNQQFGFTKGCCTNDQILELYHCMLQSLENHKVTKMLYIDVSKAFERVWRKALIHKLKKVGIRGRLLEWLKNYLEEGVQRVILRSNCSSWREMIAGVPQGPILCLLFSEDIKNEITNKLRTFADDTMISAMGNNKEEAAGLLQPDIRRISKWAARWKIDLNPSKTVCLTINRCGGVRNFLVMDGMIVKEVESHKHLRVHLSHDGRWTTHLDAICETASKRINILRQFYRRFTKQSLLQIYISFIWPKFEYCSQVLSNLNIAESELLENLQRSTIRIICGAKFETSHASLYNEVKLELLSERRKRSRLIKFWEVQNTTIYMRLNRSMLTTVGERNRLARRRLEDYTLIKCKTVQFQQSFLPRSIKEWNTLTLPVRTNLSKQQLKAKFTPKRTKKLFTGVEVTRWSSILMSRRRCRNPDLNSNLFQRCMKDTPCCDCGATEEAMEHFFMRCPLYSDAVIIQWFHIHQIDFISIQTLSFMVTNFWMVRMMMNFNEAYNSLLLIQKDFSSWAKIIKS